MKLNQLPATNSTNSKRKGRGMGSGLGKTAGRGHKGQKSRSGRLGMVGFEGGQMPLQRRLPKRGFTNNFKTNFALIKIKDLDLFDADTEVGTQELLDKGLVKDLQTPVKLLGDGEMTKPLKLKVSKASKSAQAKLEAAGGVLALTEEKASGPAD
ncbi:MAG: 50S ribosomal protein L15 [Magnetococcales bacterium]|nr:50S ribosomal protein L15 [Magnetococcales bacterium]